MGHFSNAMPAVTEHQCCRRISHKNPAPCSNSGSNVSVAGGTLAAQLETHISFDEVCPSNKTDQASHSCKHWLCRLGLLCDRINVGKYSSETGDFTCLICPGEFSTGMKTSVIFFLLLLLYWMDSLLSRVQPVQKMLFLIKILLDKVSYGLLINTFYFF